MSDLDEGLDEILNQYHMGSFSTRNRAKQDILDLMCKHRGCEPEKKCEHIVIKHEWENHRNIEPGEEVKCKHCDAKGRKVVGGKGYFIEYFGK